MNDRPIHVALATDAERFLATDQTVWFGEMPAAPAEVQLTGLPADQRFAAEVGGDDGGGPATYAGVYGVYPMSLSVPGNGASGRTVPCAGLTWVGVHPDHRRQGVLTAMLRHHLEQVRNTPGVHVSALHASEPGIYGRFGYGLASLEHEVTLGRGTTFTAPHLDGQAGATTTSLATVSDPGVAGRMHACHRAAADVGAVTGEPAFYERICLQLPEELRGKEPWRVLFARRDGEDVGFAMLRRTQSWERARSTGDAEVWALAGDAAARLALLRRLVDLDLVGSVRIRAVGVDDPMLHWVAGPRGSARLETYDSLWVRLVDLPEALGSRAWSASCDVVVEVDDRFAPWNRGTWRVTADAGGRASVRPTSDAAEVHLDVAALGAAYLGGGNLVTMLQSGLVSEHRPGAVAELWRAVRTDVAPTAAWMF